ncbi:MAG: hypothetical protein V4725_15235 [Bacteroidota bacterium]|nr:hypothetical protein [Ferruginibacter sp.]
MTNENNTLINSESLHEYVLSNSIFPGIKSIVQQACEQHPTIQALGLRPINIERIIDSLQMKGVATIGQLDTMLYSFKTQIMAMIDQYDTGAIAARHVFTPIYMLLELL